MSTQTLHDNRGRGYKSWGSTVEAYAETPELRFTERLLSMSGTTETDVTEQVMRRYLIRCEARITELENNVIAKLEAENERRLCQAEFFCEEAQKGDIRIAELEAGLMTQISINVKNITRMYELEGENAQLREVERHARWLRGGGPEHVDEAEKRLSEALDALDSKEK